MYDYYSVPTYISFSQETQARQVTKEGQDTQATQDTTPWGKYISVH